MKIQVGVFFGGKSVEHEVSVISAAQAAAAMDGDKYHVIPVYITKDNAFYTGPDLFTPSHYRDLPALLARSQRVVLVRDGGRVSLVRYPAKLFSQAVLGHLDLAFPVMHGTNGEDGSLQGFLQMHGLPYVGSDVGASANGMDKWASKCLLERAGLPVLPGHCLQSADFFADTDQMLRDLEALFGYPMIIKPVNLGSSIGISAAYDKEGLMDSIELAASFADRILVEPMLVSAREINCAVLGDADHMEASVCEEPLSTGDILSYQDKYQGGGDGVNKGETVGGGAAGKQGGKSGSKGMSGSLRKLPADLDKDKEEEIKSLAKQAFSALRCSGVVRVDFLLDKASGKAYVNELNTIPGSLSFYLWEAAGKPFRQLTDELIQLALKRNRAQERLIWSNTVNLLSGLPVPAKGAKN